MSDPRLSDGAGQVAGMMAIFAASGFSLATWGARLPGLRTYSQLSATDLGLVVSSSAAGTLCALLLAGQLMRGLQPVTSMKCGAMMSAAGFVLAVAFPVAFVTMISAFLLGFGNGLYDVAMNVRGGRLGRELGRRLLPSLHGCWSIGALAGALCAVVLTVAGVPLSGDLLLTALLTTQLTWFGTSRLADEGRLDRGLTLSTLLPRFDSWRSRRTVCLGLLALGAACAEGAANEWLTLSLTDQRGFGVQQSVAAGGLGVFIVGMIATRLIGGALLSRYRAAPMLAVSAVLVALGTVLVLLAGLTLHPRSAPALALGVLGLLCWGVGAALGVPLAMEGAAAERGESGVDDTRAPGRVSVVLTIGFAAFLPGPLLISAIGERFGYLWSLLMAPGVMLPAFGVAAVLFLRDERRSATTYPETEQLPTAQTTELRPATLVTPDSKSSAA